MKKLLIALFAVLMVGPLCTVQAAKQKTGDNDDTADLEVQRQKNRPVASAPAKKNKKAAQVETKSKKPAKGGGDGGPTGQTEDEVYIGAKNKGRRAP